jgi:transcriptional regulator with XRE-family HTH domain
MDSSKQLKNSQLSVRKSLIADKIKDSRRQNGLTQEQLAHKASVPYTTLTKIESGVIKNPSSEVINKLSKALGAPLDENSLIQIFYGVTALNKLFDDILTNLPKGEEMYITGIQEQLYLDFDAKSLKKYITQLQKRKNTQKILSCEGDRTKLSGQHISYRWIPKKYFNPTPIYTYGNKIATVLWGPPIKVITIDNLELADAYKKQFLFMWEYAKKSE